RLPSYNGPSGWYSEGPIDQMFSGTPSTPSRRSPQSPTETDLTPTSSPAEYQWIIPPRNGPKASSSNQQFEKPSNTLDLNPFLNERTDEERKCVDAFRRNKATITRNEYIMIARTYNAICKAPPAVQEWFMKTGDKAKDLSNLLGVGKNTCVTAIKFATTGNLETSGSGRTGRPKKEADQDLSSKLMNVIVESNKSGIRQNFLHDSKENVAFRITYLKRRLKNLRFVDGNWVPIMPEVFLDGSYCHIDHAAARRWVQSGSGAVNESGRKPIMAKKKVEGKFVKDSVYVWPSKGAKTQSKKAQEQEAELWVDVPEEIKQAGVIATDHDYHGNFNATLFDSIFERLCKNLNEMGLGPCQIHLDGASYHFHKKNKKPTKSDTVKTIREWLADKDIVIPTRENGKALRKDELMELVYAVPDESYQQDSPGERRSRNSQNSTLPLRASTY
ncbi:hypothetical protein BX616_006624, partial [Lobosporangium transversale]